mmetsp:Transcript_23402/g.61256  ORF Transcript_23402/g.61256 Transcript_23402/m.61256 type:complete len:281 (+) Transcript_23402:225-1067(+)
MQRCFGPVAWARCRTAVAATAAAKHSRGLASSSVDHDEINRFAETARAWWDPHGEYKVLHQLNPARLEFIVGAARANLATESRVGLAGLHVLDVGCGGGLLCEPLARLGCNVTGVDATERSIEVARLHAREDPEVHDRVSYSHSTVEELLASSGASFELVVASEVVEHVTDMTQFVHDCASAVRPGGVLVMSTLNRTALSYGLGIVLAESVLGFAPPGTHTYEKFVTPDELWGAMLEAGLHVDDTRGMVYNPLGQRWVLADTTQMNYIVCAVKPPGESAS